MKKFLWTVIAVWFFTLVSANLSVTPLIQKTPKPKVSQVWQFPPYEGFTVKEYVLFQHYDHGVRIAAVSTAPAPEFDLDENYFHFLYAISDDGREVAWGGSPNPEWGEPYYQYGAIHIELDLVDRRLPDNPLGYKPPPYRILKWRMLVGNDPSYTAPYYYAIESSTDILFWKDPPRNVPWTYSASNDGQGNEWQDALVQDPVDPNSPPTFFRIRTRSTKTWEIYIENYVIEGYLPVRQ